MDKFQKADPKQIAGNPFEMIGDGWALITARKDEKWNTMTISWGTMGILWGRPVFTAFVRPSRYTHAFLKDADSFSVCLFEPGTCRGQLSLLGKISGRDMDKMRDSGLTPVEKDGEIIFAEAKTALICKKVYASPIVKDAVAPQIIRELFENTEPAAMHTQYVGAITGAYVK